MRHLTTLRLIDQVAKSGSIRGAAEVLAITPSALQRRLQAFEEELGVAIFDRIPQGVRLNAAGELVIFHIRNQIADTERLKSRLDDLSGVRRGRISIACSQALVPYFLPVEIAKYRREFPAVSFEIQVLDHDAAETALNELLADIALVFDPEQPPKFRVLTAVRQHLYAILSSQHELAAKPVLRLRECLKHPLALPTSIYGGRQLLERAIAGSSLSLKPEVESNSFEFLKQYTLSEMAITFQIPIGAPDVHSSDGLVSRPIDARDVPTGILFMGQHPDRRLSVAAARFAEAITKSFAQTYEVVT